MRESSVGTNPTGVGSGMIGEIPDRDVMAPRHGVMNSALWAVAEALLIGLALFVFLEGWHHDIRVPLGFSVDSLDALMQSKSTVDNGWWWFNPMLGAPFGFDELAFPANSNVDQAVVWIVSRFVSDAVASINLAWAAMVLLSGLSATWCMRRLGMSSISALTAGTLFALSPYALYRNIAHLWMVIYLVPFAATAALLLATDRWPAQGSRKGSCALLLAGCALIALDYVYCAFFAAFLIGVAALVGFATGRQRRVLVAGALCLAVVSGFTFLNLAPSLYSWRVNGKPFILPNKMPSEAELYGLKIRQLVSPIYPHSWPGFAEWNQKEAAAQFPLENENLGSRLGLVGTIGFFGLLILLFVPRMADRSDQQLILLGASRLSLAAVLLGTIGGFGSLVSLLVSADIRAYNRITPFIAFFSLIAVGLAIDALGRTRGRRVLMALAVLVIGLTDQRVAAAGLNAAYPAIAAELPSLRTFVGQLESRLPKRTMVLQLPFRTYLNEPAAGRFQPYDHFKPYIVSQTLRWSYPAMSNRQMHWQETAAILEPDQLALAVAAEGFGAILIDRFGYEDQGLAIADSLSRLLGSEAVLAESNRYVAFDIRPLGKGRRDGVPNLRARPEPASAGMPACSGATGMGIDGMPHFSTREEGTITGWAIDQAAQKPAGHVDVIVGQTVFGALYGTDRPDVSTYFQQPAFRKSGFIVTIPPHAVDAGSQTVTIRVVAADRSCYFDGKAPPIVFE